MVDRPAQQHAVAAGPPFSTYPERHGNKVQLYVLGSEDATGATGAFADIAAAIGAAQKFIFICDWSFQPYVRLGPRTSGPNLAQTVGARLNARAKAGALVAIHAWNHSSAVPDDQNNDAAARLDEIASAINSADKARDPKLLFRRSNRTLTESFHQKFIVLDADNGGGPRVLKVFFGGLDLTKGRFDWADHPLIYPGVSVEPLATRITNNGRFYDDWYNAEFSRGNPNNAQPGDPTLPRQPWQDYYAQVTGPVAWDIVREFVGRWNTDNVGLSSSPSGNTSPQDKIVVENLFVSLFKPADFVQEWQPHGGPFSGRVVRSIVKTDWTERTVARRFKSDDVFPLQTDGEKGKQDEFKWRLGPSFEQSIQIAYVNTIQTAARFIYIETQYFIGSGADWNQPSVKNAVPRAIVDKILSKIKEGVDFHAYIVIPQFPEGSPVGSFSAAPAQRLFEWNTMRAMVLRIANAAILKGKRWEDFISFYFLMNWTQMDQLKMKLSGNRIDRVRANQRYMVYVHSKLMIVDDQFYICGSANLNERSLAGNRDTEIGIALKPDDGKLDECKKIIGDLRRKAWSQHLGGTVPPNVDSPETPICSSFIQIKARSNWALLAGGARPDNSHLVAFPFVSDGTSFFVKPLSLDPFRQAQDLYIFDAPATDVKPPGNGTNPDNDWRWDVPNGTSTLIPDSLAE